MEIGSCAAQVVGADLEAKMAALKALGFDFIEPAWREEETAHLGESFGAELRKLGERTGCPVRSAILKTYSGLGERLDDADARARDLDVFARACAALAAAGGDVLLLPQWAAENKPDYDARYTAFLREAGQQASAFGVKLGIEHIPASKYRNSAVQVFELAEMVDHPNVGVYFDIANGLYIDEDPLLAAPKVAPRVVQYHVKEYKKGGRSFASMPLREVRSIFEAAGFQGRVATEIGPTEQPGQQTNAHLADALTILKKNGF